MYYMVTKIESERIAYITSLQQMGKTETIYNGLPKNTRVGDVVEKDELGKISKAPDQSINIYDVMYALKANKVFFESPRVNDTEYCLFGPNFGIIKCKYRYKSASFFGVSEKDTVMVKKNNTGLKMFGCLDTDYAIVRNLTKERELRDFLLNEKKEQERE